MQIVPLEAAHLFDLNAAILEWLFAAVQPKKQLPRHTSCIFLLHGFSHIFLQHFFAQKCIPLCCCTTLALTVRRSIQWATDLFHVGGLLVTRVFTTFRILEISYISNVFFVSKMARISRNYTKFFYANLYKIPWYFEKFCDLLYQFL